MTEAAVVLTVLVGVLLVVLIARAVFGRVTIYDYQRGLRYRGGKGPDVLPPGQHWVFRPSTVVHVVDMREEFTSIAGQEVVTSDSVTVKVSLVIRHRVADPVVTVTAVSNYHTGLYSILQIGLREAIAARTIDEVLAKRDEIGPDIVRRCAEQLRTIGLELVAADVRDLMFPGPLKKTFAQVIDARQQGLAALEKARGETAALRSLANAARMVEANPSLLQLRLVQQLESGRGHTIVYGVPSTSTPLPVRSAGSEHSGLPPGAPSDTD